MSGQGGDHTIALQMRAESDFNVLKLSAPTAYLLWFFLGGLGAHRFYLRRAGSGTAMLVITLVSIPLMFLIIGFFTIWITAIWAFVDLFLISGILQQENLARRAAIYHRYGIAVPPVAYNTGYPAPGVGTGYSNAGYPTSPPAQPVMPTQRAQTVMPTQPALPVVPMVPVVPTQPAPTHASQHQSAVHLSKDVGTPPPL